MQDHEYLNEARIRSSLTESVQSWVRSVHAVRTIESTNTTLLELARESDIDGSVWTAEEQTQGRGRRGRQWVSPFAQNIALSVGIKVDMPTAQIGSVSLAVGLAVAVALEDMGVNDVQLKWPNDVLIKDRKVGGILIELADANRPCVLVVGVGVNVFDAPGRDVTGDYQATRLADHTEKCSRNELCAGLVNSIFAAIRHFEQEGFPAIKKQWENRDWLRDKEVVLLGDGERLMGFGSGIDDEGAYRLQTATGVRRVIGGNLSLRAFES